MYKYLCFCLIGITCILMIIYAIYSYIKRSKEEKKRREIQEQYKKTHDHVFKREDEKFKSLINVSFDDVPRITNIKKLVDFEMNNKIKLLAVEDHIETDVEERAKAHVFFSCFISSRLYLIEVFGRLLKADVEYFINENQRKTLYTLLINAKDEIKAQITAIHEDIQLANALNMIMAGLKKYHDVMLAISKNIPLENTTIEEHVLLIKANSVEIKDAFSPDTFAILDNECPGGKTYGVFKMLGESIEKKMVKYFEFMDVIYSELKK